MFKIIIPGVACVVTAPVTGEEDFLAGAIAGGYQIIYILCNNGDKYLHRVFGKNSDGTPCYARYKITTIPGFRIGDVAEDNKFLPDGKIPIDLLIGVQKFFKDVIAKFGDTNLEAMIWIMWNAERGYFLHVPDQSVAGASVTYDWANLPLTSEGRASRIIVDIHSHANFGAFFSGTDDRDDSGSIRYSGVIGYNRRPDPEMKFRFNFQDVKRPVELADIFSYPKPKVDDTPAEWLEKVKMTSYQNQGVYQGQGSYHGHPGYYQPQHRSGGYDGGQGWRGGHSHYSGTPAPSAPTPGPHQVVSSTQIDKDQEPPKPWTAPKPSNATVMGEKGREAGWFLEGGGFITFAAWERRYPEAIKEKRAKEAAEEAATAKQGGQQGTLPLELRGPTSPNPLHSGQPSGTDSTCQWEWVGGVRVAKSSTEQTVEPKQPGSSSSSGNSETSTSFNQPLQLEGLSTQSNWNPSDQSQPQAQHPRLNQTQQSSLPSVTGTPSSRDPTTGRWWGGALPQDQANDIVSTVSTSTTENRNTGGLSPNDSLAIFTEQVRKNLEHGSQTYVADQDTYSAVTLGLQGDQVTGEAQAAGQRGATDVQTPEDEATYQQELRNEQKAIQMGRVTPRLEAMSGAAPMGVLPVEVPQLQIRTSESQSFREQYNASSRSLPVTVVGTASGNSEVDPMSGSFCPPRLQVRPADDSQVGQAPTLIRKPVSETVSSHVNYVRPTPGQPGYVEGSFADDWLAKRRGSIRLAVPEERTIPESAIERMHSRAQQESMLEDAEELAELQEGVKVLFGHEQSSDDISNGITIWPDNTITLRLVGDDLPSFNADAVDYGPKSAGAKAVIEAGVKTLGACGRENLKRRLVQDIFEILTDDDKLPVFRTLVSSLPPHARESLETNGL